MQIVCKKLTKNHATTLILIEHKTIFSVLKCYLDIIEFIFICFLFWVNKQYINSFLFELFIFIMAFAALSSLLMEKEVVSKEELLKRVKDFCKENKDSFPHVE